MTDFITQWDDYSINFCKKLEVTMKGDWDRLDPDEQEIAALWKLLVDMYNGGFLQFFCNWGYTGYWYAMRGLQRMGATSLLHLLHQTYQRVLAPLKEDSRLTTYWDIPQYLTETDHQILNATDTAFYETEGVQFAKMAYEFYAVHLKKSV